MTEATIEKDLLRTWIEVDKKALARNYRLFRDMIGSGCRLMAVAKSNAYGHGLYDFAPAMERLGADWLGVDSIVEAVTLREIGIQKPILILGYTLPARFEEAARHRVSLTVSSFETLAALAASGVSGRVKVHIKVDTGLHRQGFLAGQVGPLVEILKKDLPRLEVEGLYTHFAMAKDPHHPGPTAAQINSFMQAAAAFERAGFRPIRHAGATAGTINHPEARFDMVRIGIGLAGLWPSAEMKAALGTRYGLEPVLSWRTLISEVKRLPMGAGISYDLTETLARDSVTGICPVGYWHGFPRSLSRVGEVLVRGRRARVLGAVTMDMIVVDLTDIPDAKAGDTATIIGRDGGDEITAYEVAQKAGGSYYELLTRLNPLIQKYYLD